MNDLTKEENKIDSQGTHFRGIEASKGVIMEDINHQPIHNGSLIQSLNQDDKRQLTKEDSV